MLVPPRLHDVAIASSVSTPSARRMMDGATMSMIVSLRSAQTIHEEHGDEAGQSDMDEYDPVNARYMP